jgi:hypothetical protein
MGGRKEPMAWSKVMQGADLLKGWREIAQYVGLDVSDTLRLAKLDGLPYFRLGLTVYCRKSRLDAWTKTVRHGTGRFMVSTRTLDD